MVPKEFVQIYRDFTSDLLVTFPELETKLQCLDENNDEEVNDKIISDVFEHCKNVYPERFFDILNKNNAIFENAEVNTEFLPGVDFSLLWKDEEVSDNTKEAIWKYLQLVMFSIIETIKSAESFGDTAKLFETMKEEDLKEKLEETIQQMQSMFSDMRTNVSGDGDSEGVGEDGLPNMSNMFNIDDSDLPNPEDLHNHISGLMGGKLGKLANEIAQETMEDLDLGSDENNDIKDVGDVFNKMFKNPGKLLNMVNKISGKLDKKMKNGELNESELMKEAAEMMTKMQNIPGLPDMQEMFKNMGNMSKPQKGQMKAKMDLNEKMSSQKERMRRKLEERRKLAQEQQVAAAPQQVAAGQQVAAPQQVASAQAELPTGNVVSTPKQKSKNTNNKNKNRNKNKKR